MNEVNLHMQLVGINGFMGEFLLFEIVLFKQLNVLALKTSGKILFGDFLQMGLIDSVS